MKGASIGSLATDVEVRRDRRQRQKASESVRKHVLAKRRQCEIKGRGDFT